MFKHEERLIDGRSWRAVQLPAREGRWLLLRIARMAGGPLARAVKLVDRPDAPVTAEDFAEVVEALTKHVEPKDVEEVMDAFLASTLVDGRKINFDLDFAGSYGTMFRVFAFALEVNYRNFFDDLLGAARTAGLSQLGPESSPKASPTRSSGGSSSSASPPSQTSNGPGASRTRQRHTQS